MVKGLSLDKYFILEGNSTGRFSYPDLLIPFFKTQGMMRHQQTLKTFNLEESYLSSPRIWWDSTKHLLFSKTVYDGKGVLIPEPLRMAIVTRMWSPRLEMFEETDVINPYNDEWLNASFSNKDGKWFIKSETINNDGTRTEFIESLEDCLLVDKPVCLDLISFLNNLTGQGMPSRRVCSGGEMNIYNFPIEEGFAIFTSGPIGFGFGVYSAKAALHQGIGARALKLKK